MNTHRLGVDPLLRAGLQSLGRTDAQLVALVALEGYAVGDAAELLGLSVPAARTRLHRARARLRERLVDGPLENDSDDQEGGR